MEPRLIRNSRRKSGQPLLALTIFFVAVTFLGAIGPLSLVFILIGLLVAPFVAWDFFDRRPQIIIDNQLLGGRRLRGASIRWGQICRVTPNSMAGVKFMILDVATVSQRTSWFEPSWPAESTGNPDHPRVKLHVRIDNLEVPPKEILQMVQERLGIRDGDAVGGRRSTN
jgi:hypothetical protein